MPPLCTCIGLQAELHGRSLCIRVVIAVVLCYGFALETMASTVRMSAELHERSLCNGVVIAAVLYYGFAPETMAIIVDVSAVSQLFRNDEVKSNCVKTEK